MACTVKMKDVVLDGTYKATLLSSDSPEAYNDIENPNRVAPKKTELTFKNNVVNLPPHSLAIVEMSMK